MSKGADATQNRARAYIHTDRLYSHRRRRQQRRLSFCVDRGGRQAEESHHRFQGLLGVLHLLFSLLQVVLNLLDRAVGILDPAPPARKRNRSTCGGTKIVNARG